MATVVNKFQEVSHSGHVYELGDTYPAEGFEEDPERVAFLSKPHPTYKRIFLYEEPTTNEQAPEEQKQAIDGVPDTLERPKASRKKTASKEPKDGE